MHGLINRSIQCFLQDTYGAAAWSSIVTAADIGFDKMIDLDLAYARTRSIWVDLAILALTARAVVSGRGAY